MTKDQQISAIKRYIRAEKRKRNANFEGIRNALMTLKLIYTNKAQLTDWLHI